MTESNEEREKRVLRELEGKNIAHYQVLLSSWIKTRMEQDKMIITLSAAAIGLLITVITAIGIRGFWPYFFAITAIVGFIIAICSCLHIFQFNAKHLEENLRSKNTKNTSNLLKKLDKLTISSFYMGIICAVLMAVFMSFQKTGGLTMGEKKQDTPKKVEKTQKSANGIKKLSPKDLETGKLTTGEKKQDTPKKVEKIQESVNGIKKLSPKDLETGKSLNGIGNLSPQNLKPKPTQNSDKTPSEQEDSGGKDKK